MLAAADCHDDLQPVAVGNQSAAVSAPRDDLAVSLHRHLLASAVEPREQRLGRYHKYGNPVRKWLEGLKHAEAKTGKKLGV